MARGRGHTVQGNVACLAEVHGVQVRLEDPRLRVAHFEQQRDGGLGELPAPSSTRIEEHGAGNLLSDRARPLSHLVPPEIHGESAEHRHRVNARVTPEAAVLRGKHGLDYGPGESLERDPVLGAKRGVDDPNELAARVEMDGGLAAAGLREREVPGGYGDEDDYDNPD